MNNSDMISPLQPSKALAWPGQTGCCQNETSTWETRQPGSGVLPQSPWPIAQPFSY